MDLTIESAIVPDRVPDLMPFYRRWGFTDQVGRSRLMRRTSDPRLTNKSGGSMGAPGSV